MKKTVLLLVSIWAFTIVSPVNLFGQNILYGILKNKDAGSPIKGARVWIQGGAVWESTTNDGEFKLNLGIGGRAYALGDKLEIVISHEFYGYHKELVPIPSDMRVEIEVTPNNIIMLMGTVLDGSSGQPIQGIDIAVFNENPNPKPLSEKIKTDENGNFSIVLRRDLHGTAQYFILALKDGSGRYKFINKPVKPSDYTVIQLERGNYKTEKIKVNKYVQSIKASLGDIIKIEATGSITVGEWIGSSPPEGRDNGVFNLPIDKWNVYREFPHAALLYKFSWEDNWKFCGRGIESVAQENGYLELMINDVKLDDNEGAYDVTIQVR